MFAFLFLCHIEEKGTAEAGGQENAGGITLNHSTFPMGEIYHCCILEEIKNSIYDEKFQLTLTAVNEDHQIRTNQGTTVRATQIKYTLSDPGCLYLRVISDARPGNPFKRNKYLFPSLVHNYSIIINYCCPPIQ